MCSARPLLIPLSLVLPPLLFFVLFLIIQFALVGVRLVRAAPDAVRVEFRKSKSLRNIAGEHFPALPSWLKQPERPPARLCERSLIRNQCHWCFARRVSTRRVP